MKEKIIDWKAPNTGHVVLKKGGYIVVKWHNCDIEYISIFTIENEKWMYNKPRYEILSK